MYRSIGINLDKETYSILKHQKFPHLNHTTSISSQHEVNSSPYCSNEKAESKACCQDDINIELCVNGHNYKMNKKNLMAVGIGALVTYSAYKAYKIFNEL
jgi:hypothetical protein